MNEVDEKDLPLMANTSEILVKHYVIQLDCELDQKVFFGSVTLFLEPVNQNCEKCGLSGDKFTNLSQVYWNTVEDNIIANPCHQNFLNCQENVSNEGLKKITGSHNKNINLRQRIVTSSDVPHKPVSKSFNKCHVSCYTENQWKDHSLKCENLTILKTGKRKGDNIKESRKKLNYTETFRNVDCHDSLMPVLGCCANLQAYCEFHKSVHHVQRDKIHNIFSDNHKFKKQCTISPEKCVFEQEEGFCNFLESGIDNTAKSKPGIEDVDFCLSEDQMNPNALLNLKGLDDTTPDTVISTQSSTWSFKHMQTEEQPSKLLSGVIRNDNFSVLTSETETSNFECILDCCDITVTKVQSLNTFSLIDSTYSSHFKLTNADKNVEEVVKLEKEDLCFSLEKWALKIWKEGVRCGHTFPQIIQIHYQTKPEGSSLLWVKDQDGRDCVFTYGASINNRSLLPCQEPPVAMATWRAIVTVPKYAIVLMSGDEDPSVIEKENDKLAYNYYTKVELPVSTLALAVGFWKEYNLGLSGNISEIKPKVKQVPCKIYSPESLLERTYKEFGQYLLTCLNVTQQLLGVYPFIKLDLLLMPKCFGSLGMASPNLIFLSQSLLAGDGSMCSRLAHEIAHCWFGLLIGAFDWTEEWLSEGFATFLEDILHALVLQLREDEQKEQNELKYALRLRILKAELINTEEDLQTLRMNSKLQSEEKTGGSFVKNGMNPFKTFIQVHYLKGYFLLRYLSGLVGLNNFLKFLQDFVEKFQHQLVLSQEVLIFFFESFPCLAEKNLSPEVIASTWLDTPGLPSEAEEFKPSLENRLYSLVIQQTSRWKSLNECLLKKTKRKFRRLKVNLSDFVELSPDQLVFVLELLLDEHQMAHRTLTELCRFFKLGEQNADVRHRWCELIVQHQYRPGYTAISTFLIEEQAMGIYLYGEMGRSTSRQLKQLAVQCFQEICDQMEPNFRVTIKKILQANNLC
ncbi:aminopeptidase O-like [Limulus polyphemus]|uniref:Aminopeptidase O-like n=1 Tax=Limulus polyphemus TaxID=6850 RepID=A0ABM1SUW9_LIMPO|nr:aminopeptidase O-like [Limulus polyphemus]